MPDGELPPDGFGGFDPQHGLGGHGGTAGAPVSSTGGTPGGAGMDPGNGNPGGGAGPRR